MPDRGSVMLAWIQSWRLEKVTGIRRNQIIFCNKRNAHSFDTALPMQGCEKYGTFEEYYNYAPYAKKIEKVD